MHGLIFYLSISPLAGSTRYLQRTEARSCLDCITQRESRTEETRHRKTEKVKLSLAYTSKGHQFDIEFANHPRLNSSGSSDIPFQNFTKYVLQVSRSSIAWCFSADAQHSLQNIEQHFPFITWSLESSIELSIFKPCLSKNTFVNFKSAMAHFRAKI